MPIVDELESAPSVEGSVLEMYKSLTDERRAEEEDLINRSIEGGVVPYSLRYGITNNVYRGVVKSGEGDLYYFNYVPGKNFKLVKAVDKEKQWDANRILTKSRLGCDLVKSGEKEEEKEKIEDGEPETKATGVAGAAMAPVPEAQAIAQQNTLTTDVHPGAAGGGGSPDIHGDRWHPEEDQAQKSTEIWALGSLLKSMGQQLQATAPVPSRMPTDKEQEFMVEVLGRNPEEVAGGRSQLSPTQRAHFNLWLNRSLGDKLGFLKSWLKDNG